jgi:hypothetical protein
MYHLRSLMSSGQTTDIISTGVQVMGLSVPSVLTARSSQSLPHLQRPKWSSTNTNTKRRSGSDLDPSYRTPLRPLQMASVRRTLRLDTSMYYSLAKANLLLSFGVSICRARMPTVEQLQKTPFPLPRFSPSPALQGHKRQQRGCFKMLMRLSRMVTGSMTRMVTGSMMAKLARHPELERSARRIYLTETLHGRQKAG